MKKKMNEKYMFNRSVCVRYRYKCDDMNDNKISLQI